MPGPRVLVLVSIVCAAALVLVGCGSDGESGQGAASKASTSTSTTLAVPLDVKVTQDVSYTSERTLDVYAPSEGSGWPVVVHFHGGVSAGPETAQLAQAVAQQGAVVVVPEWRALGPAGGSEDTVCAVAFAAAHAKDYGAATNRMTLSGYSTGGFTALIHAFIGNKPPLPVTDCKVDPAMKLPKAVVAGGAPVFAAEWARKGLLGTNNPQWAALTPEQIDAFDPYLVVGRNPDLQVRLVIGKDDVGGNPSVVFPIAETNREYFDALGKAGYDADLTEVPGGHDGPLTPGPDGMDTYVNVIVDTARSN